MAVLMCLVLIDVYNLTESICTCMFNYYLATIFKHCYSFEDWKYWKEKGKLNQKFKCSN